MSLSAIKKSKLAKTAVRMLFKGLSRLPKKKNLVVFESYLGKQFSCHPRAIYEYMKKEYPHYELVWSFNREYIQDHKNISISYARRFSWKWFCLMSRAKYWVSNSRLPETVIKSNKTTYIQTWHGTPLKKLALDMEEVHMPGTTTEKYKRNFKRETSRWDYLVSPNSYSSEIFKRAFDFKGILLETGSPRNDYLVQTKNSEELNKLKEKMNLPLDKKVILYAPTWRDNQYHQKGQYKFDLKLDIAKLKEALGEDCILILRLHYLVADKVDVTKWEDFIYDMSSYEDIRDLYLVSDMLITDYSSVFFDYGILDRPMIFYAYDLEEYREELRGFYFNFEKEAPGPLVQRNEELLTELKDWASGKDSFQEKRKGFMEKFSHLEDGHASHRAVRQFLEGEIK